MPLADQQMRDRFARETGRNFSVIAPAGVGKTTAIVARVVQLARDDLRRTELRQRPLLPKLVVVTYTRKAADEMRDRARLALVKEGLPARAMGGFNQAFFGTIHSFCLELLRRFGPLAGLPTRFTVEQDDTALWLAFQRDTPDAALHLPDSARMDWRTFGEAAALWTLARTRSLSLPMPPPPGACPPLNLDSVLAYHPKIKNQKTLANVALAQARLARWKAAAATGAGRALGVPEAKLGGTDFLAAWNDALRPLRAWLAAAAAHAAAGLAEDFAQFKAAQGRLAYDDFVRLAGGLLREPEMARRIRAEEFSILLDEAQDTDPAQFAVLLGVAQPVNAPGLWAEGAGAPPAPGRFSMVGDPQQAIYERSDVGAYLELHERFCAQGAAEALTLSVTMRCDEKIVAGVNTVFPPLLNGRRSQANFVPLAARPEAGAGAIWRVKIERPADFPADAKADERTRAEATALAQQLAELGPARLGADDWSRVAILAPRRAWLGLLAVKLREAGLRAQLHTGSQAPGADPARAWLGALMTVLADPGDVFEIAGVLREIFGISDDEIFHWCRPANTPLRAGATHPLAIYHAPPAGATGPVARALTKLHQWQREAQGLPLRDGVANLVAESRLAERLAALPGAPAPGAYAAALAALLNQAAVADARGDAPAAFARHLRTGPAEAVEPVARAGEIQLLTCHKAKGLEWDSVILFGLERKPGFETPDYPRWLPPARPGAPPECLYDKAQAADRAETKAAALAARRAEFERLLYVAATRARRRLVLVDADALDTDADSLADILGVLPDGAARAWWESLPSTIPAAKTPIGKPTATPADSAAFLPSPPQAENIQPGLMRARTFIRRVRPSTLAQHGAAPAAERSEPDLQAPPDFPEEQAPPGSVTDYGNWWHALMEHTPWTSGPAAWQAHWEKQIDSAPDPVRARAEAARLRDSPLAARLAEPGWAVATELPMLWAEPGAAHAYDGCIDFVAWNSSTQRWLVIDWKTDHTEGDAASALRRRYAAQVAVYARALASVYAAPVEAFLYGTRTGVLVDLAG